MKFCRLYYFPETGSIVFSVMDQSAVDCYYFQSAAVIFVVRMSFERLIVGDQFVGLSYR